MKKAFLSLLLCALLAASSFACAADLPEEIASVFAGESWSGYTLVTADTATLRGKLIGHAAVILERDGRKVLCVLEQHPDGQYYLTLATASAIYQNDAVPEIRATDDDYIPRIEYTYPRGRENDIESYLVVKVENTWYMNEINLYRDQSYDISGRTTINIFEYLAFTDSTLRDGEVIWTSPLQRTWGLLHRKLAHFSIEEYVRSYTDALDRLGGLPQLAEGEQQDPLPEGVPVTVESAMAISVYTGPSEQYAALNGITLKDGDAVSLLGLEGNFALVSFGEPTRYGYIPENILPSRPEVPELRFAYLNATPLSDSVITASPGGDDPLAEVMPRAGLIYLATLGSEWSYVQVNTGTPLRGFLRSEDLSVSYGVYEGTSITTAYVLYESEIIDDPYRRATPTVLGSVEMGDTVMFLDNLYGEWAYIEAATDDGPVRGYIPRDAVESIEGVGLEANG